MELSFHVLLLPGTKISYMKLSLPGTFVLWNFYSRSQSNMVSLPNMNYDYFIPKLMALQHYGLFVSLYSFIVVKDGRL